MSRLLSSMLVVAVLLSSAGCTLFDREERSVDPAANARQLYEKAERALETGNFRTAISNYETLTAVYPFSEYSKQAQLDLMYAYWQNDEPESAESIADQFILENPTHPRVDYAMYVKGLAWFPEENNPVNALFRVDLTKRPPGELIRSFNAFSQMLQRYPESPYAEDARQRMVYLRNRLAAYEIHVADYYVRRSAYVAAANRARYVVQTYQETPSVVDALQIMLRAYRELGLRELAEDTLRVLAENYPDKAYAWGGRRPSVASREPGPVSRAESPK
ncbi:MAG: outer membrane protein assembly factor BamD [Gammaproteobacteria bacterium]